MVKALNGKRIAITGSRKLVELSEVIVRQGGIPLVRPQQGSLILQENDVKHDLYRLIESGTDWMIFTTGTGFEALIEQAQQLNIYKPFIEVLRHSKIGARGYKTYAILKKLELKPIVLDDDGTTAGLIRELRGHQFRGLGVTIQLHGEEVPSLVSFFEKEGAVARTILPYKHIAPDLDVTHKLCREIIEGSIDAVCFTTAVQVRYFYQHLKLIGQKEDVNQCFKDRVLAAAVGRVTAEALREEGVDRVLVPDLERMGAMIVEISKYFLDDERA